MTTIGKLEYTIDVSSKEVQELIKKLGDIYQESLTEILLSIYHKFVNDSLTTDDLEDIGKRFSIDLEQIYLDVVVNNLEDEDDI